MAVSRLTTTSNLDDNTGTVSVPHTVDSGTDLLLLTVHTYANPTISTTPAWNTTETMTLIDHAEGGSGGDVDCYIYGLVSPTAATDSIDFTTSFSLISCTAVNYAGTDTTSVAAATNVLDTYVDNTGTGSTTDLTGGTSGSAGNGLFVAATGGDTNATPASNDASLNEIFDTVNSNLSYYVADDVAGAPGTTTVTWSTTAENSGSLIELVAASGGSSVAPLAFRHLMQMKR